MSLRLRPPQNVKMPKQRGYSALADVKKKALVDSRLGKDRELETDFATIKENYKAPKYPIVLCHGLMGFDKLRLAGKWIPGIQYWRGITDSLTAMGANVIISRVPPTSSIEERAEALAISIRRTGPGGRKVNLIGGIDARYMISKIRPRDFKVVSLTTIATPHRGSSFADYMFDTISPHHLPHIYNTLHRIGMQTGAFSQLTTSYMNDIFNPNVPDDPNVSYYSYGATFEPVILSPWLQPHKIIMKKEGPNDGLVSVKSAKWGQYEGTLVGVSHLGTINWTNRIEYALDQAMGRARKFNALALYCGAADRLAKKGF